jgi:hypothetical protein
MISYDYLSRGHCPLVKVFVAFITERVSFGNAITSTLINLLIN